MNETSIAVATETRYGLCVKAQGVYYKDSGRFHYEGTRGWYVKRSTTSVVSDPDGYKNITVVTEEIVHRGCSFGRVNYRWRGSQVQTWATKEEAEAAAFLIAVRHPEWLGKLEVRRYDDKD